MSESAIAFSAPTPIAEQHELDSFHCGEPDLDDWLCRRALANERSGASRTYVVCSGKAVAGYYCLAAGSVVRAGMPRPLQRNMPEPVPVIVLGRLAVSSAWKGKGLGAGLLRDAVLRSIRISRELGTWALLVHAISESAREFYLGSGFVESPINRMTLMLGLAKLAAASTGAT